MTGMPSACGESPQGHSYQRTPILYLNEGYDGIVVIDSGVAGLKDSYCILDIIRKI